MTVNDLPVGRSHPDDELRHALSYDGRRASAVSLLAITSPALTAAAGGESFALRVMSVTRALRIGGTSAARMAPVANRANPTITKVFRLIFSSRCNGPQVALIPDKYCTGTLLLRRV